MANQQHVEWLNEGVEAWNKRRKVQPFTPDLSRVNFAPSDPMVALSNGPSPSLSLAQLRNLPNPPDGWMGVRLNGINLSGANLLRTQFNYADLTDANLSHANLEHANLNQAFLCRANLQNARLNGAILDQATLLGADLRGAKLQNATLQGTGISDANLAGATLTGAYLNATWTNGTNLVRTNLIDLAQLPPELWKAKLFPENQSPKQHPIQSTSVETVGELLERVKEIKDLHRHAGEDVSLYFRGESQCGLKLRPSVMRKDGLLTSESRMLLELISRRPEDFSSASSALAQWVLAQHHGLKTRFLDITSNPLVALFHASEADDAKESEKVAAKEPSDGRLHVFAIPWSLIKPFNSDTVSIIANAAKLSRDDQYELVPEPSHRYSSALRRLYQQIREEKPNFEERIDPRDFYRVFVVEPQQSSERIRAQSGAFLASVFHPRFERDEILRWNGDTPVYAHYELTVAGEHNKDILNELRSINITREKLFPGLDVSAEAITEKMMVTVKPWQSIDGSKDIRFSTGSTHDDSKSL